MNIYEIILLALVREQEDKGYNAIDFLKHTLKIELLKKTIFNEIRKENLMIQLDKEIECLNDDIQELEKSLSFNLKMIYFISFLLLCGIILIVGLALQS